MLMDEAEEKSVIYCLVLTSQLCMFQIETKRVIL